LPPLVADGRRRGADGEGVEDIVWAAIDGVFRDEQTLRGMVRVAREQNDSAAEHAARLAFVRATLAEKRQAHQRAADRAATAVDDLAADAYEQTRAGLAREIRSFEADVKQLERVSVRGISDADEAALLSLGRAFRALGERFTASDKRRFCAGVGLGVRVVALDVGGTAVGRHRYELEGTALGQALRSSSDDNLTWLSLQLLRSDAAPFIAVSPVSQTA
jgi:hypothetical protein